jgi:hypothetical protein
MRGWKGNIMGELPGSVDERNIQEALDDGHNVIRY